MIRSTPSLAVAATMLVMTGSLADEADVSEKPRWLVIHAGTLLSVPGEAALEMQTIVVRDDRITAIREGYIDSADAVDGADHTDVQFVDLSDAFVLPGLMDMHVHLSFEFDVDGQRNYGGADDYLDQHRSSRDDAYQFVDAIGNARKTLQAGFTTVRNVGSSGWHIFALRDAIRDGTLEGPRIVASGHTIRVGADDGSGACTSVDSCRKATREQIDMGADLIKIYATCSGGKPCGHEDAPPVFLEDELRAIVDTAATRELSVAAHAHGTAGINLAASTGVDSIEHGSYNDEQSHRLMRRNSTFLVPTLAVRDNILRDIEDATGEMRDVMQGFLDNHGTRMAAAHRAGVRIAAGSDAGVTVHGNNARELELYVENGLTPEEAIIAATVHAAELIGMQDDLGTIETGKIADLIAIDANPLENILELKDVAVVVKGGKVVKDTR